MRDILAVRRNLAMMEKTYPNPLDSVFEGMQQNASPWNLPPSKRLEWAQGLVVPTIEENPAPEILWWVGCAPASDPRAQGAARAFAQILIIAGVNFAVLGNREACTGDSARRAGREDIFQKLAVQNIHTLNEVNPRRIVTTCPHCLHTLKNEYPAFGGNYQVIHHTQLINELVGAGKLQISVNDPMPNIEKDPPTYKRWYSSKKPPLRPFAAYHDPCYLGRYNGQYGQPRKALRLAKVVLLEMPRNAETSFCCGAGGGLAWDQQDDNRLKMSQMRYAEAKQIGLSTLAVACPFCQSSLGEASRADGFQVQVRDVAEIVLERIKR
jgi:Fe-S oxidoreductase